MIPTSLPVQQTNTCANSRSLLILFSHETAFFFFFNFSTQFANLGVIHGWSEKYFNLRGKPSWWSSMFCFRFFLCVHWNVCHNEIEKRVQDKRQVLCLGPRDGRLELFVDKTRTRRKNRPKDIERFGRKWTYKEKVRWTTESTWWYNSTDQSRHGYTLASASFESGDFKQVAAIKHNAK